MIKLIKPTIELETQFYDMIEDFRRHGEKPKPWTINIAPDNLPLLIKKLEDFEKGIGLERYQVEHSTFWLVENKYIMGAVNIRHRLNDYLLKYDGHIGGSIRPSARGKGYGTHMLKIALKEAKKLNIDCVLVTCNKGNHASERSIISNGGVFESEIKEDNGNIVLRYWIDNE